MNNPTPKGFGHTLGEVSIMRKANIAVSLSILVLLLCSFMASTVSAADIGPQRSYRDDLVLLATGEAQQLSYDCDSYSEVSTVAQSISNVYAGCFYQYPEYFSDDFKINFEVEAVKGGKYTLSVVPLRTEAGAARQSETYISANWFLSELYKNGKLSKDMTERQRAKVILDWVSARVTYDNSDELAKTGWSAICRMKANCNGYTALYDQMLRADGIQCHGVLGFANGGYHLWSAVILDGTEYYTDATWYDSSGGTKYCALTRSEMEADHTFAEDF